MKAKSMMTITRILMKIKNTLKIKTMTNKNYRQILLSKGYVMNDGEIGFEKRNGNGLIQVQVYISPEDEMYELYIYNHDGETGTRAAYKSMQTLTAALKNKGLI